MPKAPVNGIAPLLRVPRQRLGPDDSLRPRAGRQPHEAGGSRWRPSQASTVASPSITGVGEPLLLATARVRTLVYG